MFRVYFNRRKQFFEVVLHDVHPNTFERKGGGRWAYYENFEERDSKLGLFGTIHCVKSRVREDVIAHELFHLLSDWIFTNGYVFSTANEEKFATFLDEITRGFYREYNKQLW